MDFIHLTGAEEVQRAGHNMASAAESITQAAARSEEMIRLSLDRLERALDDHARRIEVAAERVVGQMKAASEGGS